MNDAAIGQAIADANYALMGFFGTYIGAALAIFLITIAMFGLTPLKAKAEFNFIQVVLIWYRKLVLISLLVIALLFLAMYAFYVGMNGNPPTVSTGHFVNWLVNLAMDDGPMIGGGFLLALIIRFTATRYIVPWGSGLWRKWRVEQSNEKLDDIRDRSNELKAVDYLPQNYYANNHVFLGMTEDMEPIIIPDGVWNETNMQIIGPTRYGKGVLIGCILDQQIRKGRGALYVDPKGDKFAPHIMCRAAKETGREFIYLDLSDNGVGSWAPFRGGNERDALTRLEMAFALEYTGDSATDYYKGQERKALDRAFKTARDIETLKLAMENTDSNRINAELARWTSIRSLCPPEGIGFNMDKALLSNAVIYVKGSLDDSIIKTATTIFIAEHIQAARRLELQLKIGTDSIIDEVSSLASRTLAMSLATSVGFGVRFSLAYQSQGDLLNIEDSSVSGRYVYQSINVNSQIKAVYGGADHETAQWIADLSGTVMKAVPKMERSEINASGGEVWAGTRFIGTEEANLISINTVLALPPRVGVLVSPGKLARLCFTAFVPIDTEERLAKHVLDQAKLDQPIETIDTTPATTDLPAQSGRDRRSKASEKMGELQGVVSGGMKNKDVDNESEEATSSVATERDRERRRERKQIQNAKKKAANKPEKRAGGTGDRKSVGAIEGE